jgi:hypothetical protein
MKKIDPSEAWGTSLLLYSLPMLLEAIDFINLIVIILVADFRKLKWA